MKTFAGETVEDLIVPWVRHPGGLVLRMLALADEFRTDRCLTGPDAAERIWQVIRCDYDPLPPVRAQLRVPPTLRPAVPSKPEVGS